MPQCGDCGGEEGISVVGPIANYLFNRKQCATIGTHESHWSTVHRSLFQGSVLGPFLSLTVSRMKISLFKFTVCLSPLF